MHEVKTIVLDEGDELLGKEHLDDVRRVVKSALNDRQLLLFSATALQDPDQVTAMLGREPERIVVDGELAVPSEIEHIYLLCEPREKINLLGKIAKMDGMKGLAFIRSIGNLHVIADKLSYEGVDLEILHSDMRKDERKKALQRLDSGDVSILLATDIAARGLDIKGYPTSFILTWRRTWNNISTVQEEQGEWGNSEQLFRSFLQGMNASCKNMANF